MKDLQKRINDFVEEHKLTYTPEIYALDLLSEIGEVAKEILKSTNYGKKIFKKTEETDMEMGDLLYSLITLANSLDVDLDESLNKVLKKYEKRIKFSKSAGSGR